MHRVFLIIIGLILIGSGALADDDITIKMQVSPDTIGLTDQAYLTITVSGPRQDFPRPNMPNLSMFEYYSQGTSTNVSITNGTVESQLRYQYLLAPKRKGTFVIKPAVIVLDQKRYESNEVIVTVLEKGVATPKSVENQAKTKTGENRDVFMVASVDKKRAYVNEQVTLKIKFYHAVKLYSQPSYTAPQTTDFWADLMEPQNTYYETINGRRYKAIEITTALFPTRSGELTIGPAKVDVSVASQRDRQRNNPFALESFFNRGEPITVRSKPVSVEVLPLPTSGKPDGFTGTVGNFTIRSSIDKRSTEVNQPVTVTYKISGTGNIRTIAEPEIGELQSFRIYRASSSEKISKIDNVLGGTKIFEEVYIPKKAGVLTIPPVKLDYFDPKAKKYRSIATKPIALNVSQAEGVEYVDVPYQPVAGRVVNTTAKDIRYIKTDPGRLEKARPLILFTPLYLVLNGLSVVLLLGAVIVNARRKKYATDVGYARSRTARKMAKKRLSEARKLNTSGKHREFYAEIRQAIISYVADKTNCSPHGLTSDALVDMIKNAGASDDILADVKEVISRADFAQYSSATDHSIEKNNDTLQMAENLLVKLEETRFE